VKGLYRLVGFYLLLLLVGCDTASEKQPTAERVVKIAVLYDSVVYSAKSMRAALRIASDEINARGGISHDEQNYQLQLIERDSQGKPTLAAKNARELIYKDKVLAIIGPNLSRTAMAAANVAENAGVVMISPASSHPSTTQHHDYVFRMTFVDPVQARLMARFAINELGLQKVAVIYNEVSPSTAIVARRFIRSFKHNGGMDVYDLPYVNATALLPKHEQVPDAKGRLAQQWRELAQLVSGYGVDAVYLPSSIDEVIAMVTTLREFGYRGLLLGSDNWSPRHVVNDENFNGSYFTHHYFRVDDASISQTLKQALKTTIEDGHSSSYSVLAVDALNLLVEAIEKVDVDHSMIRSYLISDHNFKGISGRVHFDSNGNNQINPTILTIEKRQLRQILFSDSK